MRVRIVVSQDWLAKAKAGIAPGQMSFGFDDVPSASVPERRTPAARPVSASPTGTGKLFGAEDVRKPPATTLQEFARQGRGARLADVPQPGSASVGSGGRFVAIT